MKLPPANLKKRGSISGLTLIELLVVMVVIIAVLTLGVSVLGQARERSRDVQNVANLRQLGLAVIAYAADHSGNIPAGLRDTDDGPAPGPRFGSAASFGAPPRRLFRRGDPCWGEYAEGPTNYLETADVLYSPHVANSANYKNRVEGKFIGVYGYIYIYSPQHEPLMPAFFNTKLSDGANQPIYSDLFGDSATNARFPSSKCMVLYLDGNVRSLSQAELQRRSYNNRFRYMMTDR